MATRKKHATGSAADLKFEASLGVIKIPRCPACKAANPKGADHCPACGVQAPLQSDRQYVDGVIPDPERFIPWYARVLLAIGTALRRLHNYLEKILY